MRITNPAELAALHEATVRERVRRFIAPAEGLNLDELAELLCELVGHAPSVRDRMRMAVRSMAAHRGETGVHSVQLPDRNGTPMPTNLVYLGDVTAFARHVGALLGMELPEWFLDDIGAAQVVAALARMNRAKEGL
jgi:hypothetical protein